MGRAYMHGWLSLPTRGEIYFDHGLPRRVWIDAAASADVERLAEEAADLGGLQVTLGGWEAAADGDGVEAMLRVSPAQIGAVLDRLARHSAEAFVDRYQKAIDPDDIDFDDEAYAEDMGTALGVCGLHWNQVDAGDLRRSYRTALHRASTELAAQH